jgi:murein tripeptide amidase MpaA
MRVQKNRRVFVIVVCAVGFAVTAAQGEQPQPQPQQVVCYDGQQVIRVYVHTPEQLESLQSFGFDIWDDIPHLGPVDVRVSQAEAEAISKLGLDFKVKISDVQALVERERAYAPRDAAWFTNYHTFSEINAWMDNLALTHPSQVSILTIGDSLEGRAMRVLKITGSGGGPKPGVFYHGGQHAREWITPPVVCYLAEYLLDNYGTDPTATALMDRADWYLLPVMNPDGYVYTQTDRMWRKNRRNNGGGYWGVDLNRNWGYYWGGPGSSSSPGSEIYHGTGPFSEPETANMRDFIVANPDIQTHIDFHSYSEMIMWPWGYTGTLPPDNDTFSFLGLGMQAEIAAVHGHVYQAGPIYDTIYQVSGSSVDWVYGDQGIWSMTLELRDTGEYGFLLPADQIIPTCEENLPSMLFLAEWATAPVRFQFPNGLPEIVAPGVETPVTVTITGGVQNLVPGTATLYYRDSVSEGFTPYPLTWLGGDDYQAVLPAAACVSAPQYYFSAEGDLGAVSLNPVGAPGAYHTAVVADQNAFFQEDFEANPGWSTQGLWAWGHPNGGGGAYGGPDPNNAHSGNNVYGYNLNGDYENNLPEMHLTSPAIDCTGQFGVRLSFWRWLGVETPTWDHAYVRVSNDGINWVTVWENTGEVTDTQWTLQQFDISAVADDQPTVYLRWTMGTTDTGWQYCGWNIDDVSLVSLSCNVPPSPADFDVDGDVDLNDFATFSRCYSGDSVTTPPPGCAPADFALTDLDGDTDVDLNDFNLFAQAFTG